MHEHVIERAQDTELNVRALGELARRLPADDGELDALLAIVVSGRHDRAFAVILAAALDAGRVVDARHLVGGMALLPGPHELTVAAGHCAGDVAAALVEAVRTGHGSWEREAVALFLAARWCREHGRAWPEGLLQHGRRLARKAVGPETRLLLLALAEIVADDGIAGAVAAFDNPTARRVAARIAAGIVEAATGPVLAGVPEEPEPHVLTGFTVRRAVPRVGRNEPCHCGSGKKYKHCCAERDRERLRDSSDVPGVTRGELRVSPEEHLTGERLAHMRSHELVRLDPTRVDPHLHSRLLDRLLLFDEYDAVASFFERVGATAELDQELLHAADDAATAGRRDVVQRLLALRVAPAGADSPGLLARLLTMPESPGPALNLIEEEARKAVDRIDGPDGIVDLAFDLLDGPAPALGILAARGAMVTSSGLDREMLLESLLETRDRLDLPPDDPIEAILPLLEAAEERDDEVEEELVGEHARLEEKTAEITELRRDVTLLRQELASQKRSSPRPAAGETPRPATAAALPPADDARVAELRERVASLRAALVERHAERNELRREAEHLRTSKQAPAAGDGGAAREENDDEPLLLPDDGAGAQPPRVPVFSAQVRDALAALPQRVARAAVEESGRLAAGTPSAFRGARRLRLHRDLWRQRFAGSYRLVFTLRPGELEVLALVHRHDLERTARTLAKTLPAAPADRR